MTMNLKQKMSRVAVAAHPKIVTLGISFAIVAAIGIGLGAVGTTEQAFAGNGRCAFGLDKCFCYSSTVLIANCFSNAQDCKQTQSTDPNAAGRCYRGT
jgi:hypothetical protein